MAVNSRKQPVISPPATNQAPHFLRRSTVSAQQILGPQARLRMNPNGQCTHLTMTRLYTKEYRCSICLRIGPFGWLYRCTQDRELLLEDDMETGCEERLDDLCDIFPRSPTPRERGPLARMNKLAVLEGIGKEQLKQYTNQQLSTILQQRAHVLDMATQPDLTPLQADISSFRTQDLLNNGLKRAPNRRSGLLPIDSSMPISNKPWLPLRGGECQFKCCHFCRPSLKDRSFLSIDGIVNDDVPATAITAFGFHLQKSRPVAPTKIVKNLGLRPNPVRPDRKDTPNPFISRSLPQLLPPPTPRHAAATLGLGLGIFTAPLPDQSTSSIIAPIPLPISPNAIFIDSENIPFHPQNRTSDRAFPLLNTIAPTQRRHSISVPTTTSGSEAACQIPLPDQTPQELKLIEAGLLLTPNPDRRVEIEEMKTVDVARPLTPMEESELRGTFGREPLDVKDGVAMTEESIELHVPDVITQF